MTNKTIIIGSYAINRWYGDYSRIPDDVDYVVKGSQTIFIDELSKRQELHTGKHWQYLLDYNKNIFFADPNMIYTIKVSHLAWDINFDKHMKDVIFLKSKGCILIPEFYQILFKAWEEKHGSKSHIKLSASNDKFFNENVTREMNHDRIHELVAFYDRPLHEKIRIDANSALPNKNKWEQLSYNDKIKCALEEIYVIYLERFNHLPINHGIVKALKQLITTMTKGYFNLFLIENFEELRTYPKDHLNTKIKGLLT